MLFGDQMRVTITQIHAVSLPQAMKTQIVCQCNMKGILGWGMEYFDGVYNLFVTSASDGAELSFHLMKSIWLQLPSVISEALVNTI